jgi:hypothetical protein
MLAGTRSSCCLFFRRNDQGVKELYGFSEHLSDSHDLIFSFAVFVNKMNW